MKTKYIVGLIAATLLASGCGGGGGGSTSTTISTQPTQPSISTPPVTTCANGDTNYPACTTSAMVTPIPTSPDGDMEIDIPATNSITGFAMTTTVPPLPTDKTGVMYIWPGLQTGGVGPVTLLQPLLIYGPGGCGTPTTAEDTYATYYVEGYNISPDGTCSGGSMMAVNPGDTLTMAITQTSASAGSYLQTITDVTTSQNVTWSITAAGLQLLRAMITIESDNGNTGLTTSAPIAFTDITLTLANPQSGNWCNPSQLGSTDTMTVPVISADTKSCSISKVTLMTGPTTDGTSKN